MNDCRFCGIVAGDVDAHVLVDDERTVAFLDENPATEGHVLVVPKAHAEDLLLLDVETVTAVARTAREVAVALDATLEPDGYSTFHTTGGLVGTVEHAHLHVIPRSLDDGIHLSLERDSLDPADAEWLTEQVRTHRSQTE